MKKFFFILATALLSCGALVSCSDKDDDNGNVTNQFTYDSKTVKVTDAAQLYYGHYEGHTAAINIMLLIAFDDGMYLLFDMYVPNGNEELPAGTYKQNDNGKAGTYLFGGIAKYVNGELTRVYTVEDATINVSLSGDTYTINVNGTLEGGKTISGNYTGELEWFDGRD